LNDVIIRTAATFKLPLIELRLIFTSVEDYANPIEPSAIGGAKLVTQIASVLETHPFDKPKCIFYP